LETLKSSIKILNGDILNIEENFFATAKVVAGEVAVA
jgi:hypothetical protein